MPSTTVVGRLRVFSAFEHEGVARRLVHRLKYGGLPNAGWVLVDALQELLPSNSVALVPVPRAAVRKARYGTDPAAVLAGFLGREAGLPVVRCLRPPIWWPAHAGSNRAVRRRPPFRLVRDPPNGSVLIDDVVTTGATLQAAAAVSGIGVALTATRASGVRSG
ncbi:MAG: hypothetical protein QNJ77_04785 [Acidimicrobiia bacterium]|nr:hypothetical protein [Acidimicrobiia bacterium]